MLRAAGVGETAREATLRDDDGAFKGLALSVAREHGRSCE